MRLMFEVKSSPFKVLASVGRKVHVNGKWPVNVCMHSFSRLLPNQGHSGEAIHTLIQTLETLAVVVTGQNVPTAKISTENGEAYWGVEGTKSGWVKRKVNSMFVVHTTENRNTHYQKDSCPVDVLLKRI